MRSNTTHYRFLPISINGFPAVDSKTRLVLSPIAQSMMNNALDMLYQLERHNSNFMNKKLDLPPLYVYAHRQPSVERDANSNMVGTVCVYVLGGTGDYTQHAPDFSEYLSTSAIKGLGAVGDYIGMVHSLSSFCRFRCLRMDAGCRLSNRRARRGPHHCCEGILAIASDHSIIEFS